LWVTQEGKLFERNALNPEVLFLRNNLGQSAMIAGETDMCSYSTRLLAPARVQGTDLVMIVSFQQKLNYRLVVRPEIRTLADLTGKVLGVTRHGTVNDVTIRLLLNKLGRPRAGCPINSSRRFRSCGGDFVDRRQNLRRRTASAAVL
jgi:ABC-type nitrate/sulfonate/bicarbonate transport system substrate-binding protein